MSVRSTDDGFRFSVDASASQSLARAATLGTPHGEVQTPLFMPVGTHGSIKGLVPAEVKRTGTRWILSTTYHLHLRPGEDVVRELGGLHRFMGWDGPILTASGGYQMFSLEYLTKLDERRHQRGFVSLPEVLLPDSFLTGVGLAPPGAGL